MLMKLEAKMIDLIKKWLPRIVVFYAVLFVGLHLTLRASEIEAQGQQQRMEQYWESLR